MRAGARSLQGADTIPPRRCQQATQGFLDNWRCWSKIVPTRLLYWIFLEWISMVHRYNTVRAIYVFIFHFWRRCLFGWDSKAQLDRRGRCWQEERRFTVGDWMKDCCHAREMYVWQTRYLDRSPPGGMEGTADGDVWGPAPPHRISTPSSRAASWMGCHRPAFPSLCLIVFGYRSLLSRARVTGKQDKWQGSNINLVEGISDTRVTPVIWWYDPVWFTLPQVS
jgi:hypothetical protein